MRGFVPPDPQSGVSEVQYAVVYAPRRKRTRFTAGCVTPVASREEALAAAEPAKNATRCRCWAHPNLPRGSTSTIWWSGWSNPIGG